MDWVDEPASRCTGIETKTVTAEAVSRTGLTLGFLLFEQSGSCLIGREQAGRDRAAEPPDTVSCDEAVGGITNGPRNQHGSGEPPIGTPESPHDAQDRCTAHVSFGFFDEHHGVQLILGKSVLAHQPMADFGLEGGEVNFRVPFVAEDELHPTVAQIALAVEQQDGMSLRWHDYAQVAWGAASKAPWEPSSSSCCDSTGLRPSPQKPNALDTWRMVARHQSWIHST